MGITAQGFTLIRDFLETSLKKIEITTDLSNDIRPIDLKTKINDNMLILTTSFELGQLTDETLENVKILDINDDIFSDNDVAEITKNSNEVFTITNNITLSEV